MSKKQKFKINKQRTIEPSKISKIRKTLNTTLSLIAISTLGYIGFDYYSQRPQEEQQIIQTNNSKLEEISLSAELKESIEKPEKRQQYLDKLIKDSKPKYCSEVIYDQTGDKLIDYLINLGKNHGITKAELKEQLQETEKLVKNGEFDAKTPEIFDFSGEGTKPPIFIGKKLFSGKYSELEIKNAIVYHEGRHAEQATRGLESLGYIDKEIILDSLRRGTIPYEVLYEIGELDAMNYELKGLEDSNNKNNAYYERTLKNYRATRALLRNVVGKTEGSLREFLEKGLKVNPKR